MCGSCETTTAATAGGASTGALDFVVRCMTCGVCAAKVTIAVQGVPGVTDVVIDLGGGRLSVEGSADESAITAAVESAGCTAVRV